MVLYSNTNYLKKYNEDIPTTWDKLLEVGENIVKQERNNNNNMNFYGYNGLFPTSNFFFFFFFKFNIICY